MQFIVSLLILLCGVVPPASRKARRWSAALRSPIRWLARTRRRTGFGLGRMLEPARSVDVPLTNDALFALPSMAPVRRRSTRSSIAMSPGTKPDLAERDHRRRAVIRFSIVRSRAAVFAADALRAGRHRQPDGPRLCAPESCGEIRLIYRLTRTAPAEAGEARCRRVCR